MTAQQDATVTFSPARFADAGKPQLARMLIETAISGTGQAVPAGQRDYVRAIQAADIVWATNSAEMYQLLVSGRGWSAQRHQDFLADTWRRLLLAD